MTSAPPGARAWQQPLPWGPVLRGIRLGAGPHTVFFLHEPGADLDAWGDLPRRLATILPLSAVAVDLPGHGLSDDPWEPDLFGDVLRTTLDSLSPAGKRFVIAAGSSALAALDLAAVADLAGLVCLTPEAPLPERRLLRSPRVPKQVFASSLAGDDLAIAQRLASACAGWAVVTSVPVEDHGTALLTSPWGVRIAEQIAVFLRDCLYRPLHPAIHDRTGRARSPSGKRLAQ